MDYGICSLSNVPVRSEASDKAELVTQLFFGECYQVLQKEGNWFQIQIAADNYVGWIDFKQHFSVTDEYFLEWKATQHPRSIDIVQTVSSANVVTPVLMGSILPFFDGITLRLGHEKLIYNGRASNLSTDYRPAFLAKLAQIFFEGSLCMGR